ncbi:MAG: TetR/AcrR family transcriptional regulator [Sporichthyaceae bacterium]
MTDLDSPPRPELSAHSALAVRLLDAAEAEIVERGSTEISLRAVARRVGVSHQAPGFAFTDRQGLLTALAVRGYQLLEDAIVRTRDAMPAGADGRETLAEMGVTYIRTATARPALFWLIARPDLGAGSAELVAARGHAVGVLTAAVRVAMADGWQPHRPMNELATLAWATVHGLSVLHPDALSDLTDSSRETTARQVLRAMVAL